MNEKNEDYQSAMRILEELCVRHDVPASEKVRELFWRGVLLGHNRANARKFGPQFSIATLSEKEKPKDTVGAERLAAPNPSVVSPLSQCSDQTNTDELGDAVSFRL